MERSANLSEGTADMNADGKSDDFVVPSTRVNKAATAVAESVEERKSPKGSIAELPSMFQTLCWIQHPLEWHGTHDGYQRRVLRSFDLTEEPYEVILHVRICTGGPPVTAIPTAILVVECK